MSAHETCAWLTEPIPQEELDKNESVFIDVRTPKETAQGVIGAPKLITLGPGMKGKLSKLDRSKKYIVYCRSGKRSAMASNIMAGMGFSDVNNLEGGYLAWMNR